MHEQHVFLFYHVRLRNEVQVIVSLGSYGSVLSTFAIPQNFQSEHQVIAQYISGVFNMATTGDDDFLPEVWGLYALGSLYIVLRFAVRLRADGWKGFRLDDAFAIIALLAWTYTCAIIHITHYTGTIIDFTVAELVTFDQSKFDQVEYGSKLFLGSWYSQ